MNMQGSKTSIAIPLLVMTVGTGWLLTAQEVIPGVDWAWVLGLGAAGVLTLAVGGVDKVTVVVGPFLIASTFFSLLRQTGRIDVDTEVPCLVILAGALALLSRFMPVRPPSWFLEEPAEEEDRDRGQAA